MFSLFVFNASSIACPIELIPCSEGISVKHPRWIEYLELGTSELKERYSNGKDEDFVALGLALNVAAVREKHQVGIISDGISNRDAERMHFSKFHSVENAHSDFSQEQGQN